MKSPIQNCSKKRGREREETAEPEWTVRRMATRRKKRKRAIGPTTLSPFPSLTHRLVSVVCILNIFACVFVINLNLMSLKKSNERIMFVFILQ